jgi:hypothetical protein
VFQQLVGLKLSRIFAPHKFDSHGLAEKLLKVTIIISTSIILPNCWKK